MRRSLDLPVGTTQGAPTVAEQTRSNDRTPDPQQASLPEKSPPPSRPPQPPPPHDPQLLGQQTVLAWMPGMPPSQVTTAWCSPPTTKRQDTPPCWFEGKGGGSHCNYKVCFRLHRLYLRHVSRRSFALLFQTLLYIRLRMSRKSLELVGGRALRSVFRR